MDHRTFEAFAATIVAWYRLPAMGEGGGMVVPASCFAHVNALCGAFRRAIAEGRA